MSINVTRSSMPPFDEYCREIQGLWDSCWLTNMGTKHQELRSRLIQYLGVKNLELITNGHMAIELSLQAMELEGEVITTPFTFASTTQAIVRNGLTPVFCDIDPVTYTLDPSRMESLITNRTSAIVPVHVYGNICDVEKIDRIAQRYGLKVLYDAAHAFGVRYKGQGIASFGDVSCFSFHATKVFHTVEGGAACFHDVSIGRRLAKLRNFGLDGEDASEFGSNAKLDEFRAAMGLCNLRYLDHEIAKREQIANCYRIHLEKIPGIQLKEVQPGVKSNYAYFPVLFDPYVFGSDRDHVLSALSAQGIMARKYFYPLTSTFSCFSNIYNPEETPTALRVSRQVLCLPIFADMDHGVAEHICEIILNCRGAL